MTQPTRIKHITRSSPRTWCGAPGDMTSDPLGSNCLACIKALRQALDELDARLRRG